MIEDLNLAPWRATPERFEEPRRLEKLLAVPEAPFWNGMELAYLAFECFDDDLGPFLITNLEFVALNANEGYWKVTCRSNYPKESTKPPITVSGPSWHFMSWDSYLDWYQRSEEQESN